MHDQLPVTGCNGLDDPMAIIDRMIAGEVSGTGWLQHDGEILMLADRALEIGNHLIGNHRTLAGNGEIIGNRPLLYRHRPLMPVSSSLRICAVVSLNCWLAT